MYHCVHLSNFYNSQDMEATSVQSIDVWIKMMQGVCMYMCVYVYIWILVIKKENESLPFTTTSVDLEGIMLSEISQGKTSAAWFHLYVESIKQVNKHNKKETVSYTHRTNRWLSVGTGVGRVEKWVRKIKSTNFQLQNTWVLYMKCTVRQI